MNRPCSTQEAGIGRVPSERSAAGGRVRRSAARRHRPRVVAFAALLMAGAGAAGAAGLTFDAGISQGMVLQRSLPVTLSGRGTPDSTLTLTLASQSQVVRTAADGRWTATLSALPPGGPHTITASEGGLSVSIDDVWVGDVWLASGQSNMQMGLAESIGGQDVLAELGRQPAIRFLEMPRGGADSPQSDPGAEWSRPSPALLARFSAVACHFAAHLRRDPALAEVPLGLINSSFGGTSIEAWSPDSLSDLPKDRLSGSMFGIPPGALFNRMIHPLLARPIRGVLWYQGEANAGQPGVYGRLLRNLMERWRSGWHQPDLPFLIVQLPAFEGKMGGLDFGWLREAQDQACTGFPKAWSVVTYDTTDGFDLHPKEKQEIGRRLALVAKREVYGLEVSAHGPRRQKVEPSGRQLIVTFDQEVHSPPGGPVLGFEIAGEDGEARFAEATIRGDTVILESAAVPLPKTLRYAWGGLTRANLTGRDGLPAFAFRTDELPPDSTVFQPLPTFQRIETPAYQLETGSNGRIASLIVGGRQFLSNDAPGGTAVPGGFGFRNLAHTTVLGPRRLTLSDGGVTLEVACLEKEMTWTLINHGNDPVDLHLNLAAKVEADAQGAEVTLTREGVRLHLSGINRLEGQKIIAQAPPGASARLRFLIEKP